MPNDDAPSSFNAPSAPSETRSGRRPAPRWIVPFLIVDTLVFAGVLYWLFGSARSETTRDDTPANVEVRGAPINEPRLENGASDAEEASAASSTDDFGGLDDDEWEDLENDEIAAQPALSTGPIAQAPLTQDKIDLLFGMQQALPRPTIERDEFRAYTPASFEDIGDWKYQRNWSGHGVGSAGPKIPANVLAWNNKKIAILGYMQPLELDENNRVRSFMLMRNQAACCYGAPITLADWIEVKAPAGRTFEATLHKPITVLGVLDVGEKLVDDFAVSVFRMTPDHVLPPGETP
ncbi:MAG TPA: DUF3299 domain-containing protein [Phycisphaerae bacterium]|nr:DUF3299 domain-containing protein [Phycisphaerae bacterium]HRW55191.1 DUF3299 domain-containing protein [Phycisphaerae bacterium]